MILNILNIKLRIPITLLRLISSKNRFFVKCWGNPFGKYTTGGHSLGCVFFGYLSNVGVMFSLGALNDFLNQKENRSFNLTLIAPLADDIIKV